jgi:hypothetical protein
VTRPTSADARDFAFANLSEASDVAEFDATLAALGGTLERRVPECSAVVLVPTGDGKAERWMYSDVGPGAVKRQRERGRYVKRFGRVAVLARGVPLQSR